jgi:hypothetical protein
VCPCKAIARRVRYLVHHKQPPSTPLCQFFQDSVTKHVTPTDIRTALRRSLAALGPANLGIKPDELEARSPRAGGATGWRGHSTTLCQGRPKLNPTPWQLEVGCHDSIPSYSGKPACTTIRKSNVLQRTLVFPSAHEHSINQSQLSYQTFSKLEISIPHLFGASFSFHGPLGDAG